MTAVSSEWRRFLSRQVPLPNAASTSTRFEIDLDPGVAIVTGARRGMPPSTLIVSLNVFLMTSSLTTLAFCSSVDPIRLRRTIFFSSPEFFLSIRIMSSSLSTVRSLA
jgi:hypothetical protein